MLVLLVVGLVNRGLSLRDTRSLAVVAAIAGHLFARSNRGLYLRDIRSLAVVATIAGHLFARSWSLRLAAHCFLLLSFPLVPFREVLSLVGCRLTRSFGGTKCTPSAPRVAVQPSLAALPGHSFVCAAATIAGH